MKERDIRLDLIKFIAAVMVVILHTVLIEPSGGVQEWMYLLGTFGIPLFLLVNGFLLYERDITPDYVWKKLIRYIKFILMWTIIIGILYEVC